MIDKNDLDVNIVYEMIKEKYDLKLARTCEFDANFTVDSAIIIGAKNGLILYLYSDSDGDLILDVMNETQTEGTHWHPINIADAAKDISEFMEGKRKYKLYHF